MKHFQNFLLRRLAHFVLSAYSRASSPLVWTISAANAIKWSSPLLYLKAQANSTINIDRLRNINTLEQRPSNHNIMKLTDTFLFAALAIFVGAADAASNLLPRITSACIVPTTGAPDTSSDASLSIPYVTSTSTSTSTSTGAAAVTCFHAADPENTCAAIADGPGWCECGTDPATYAIMPSPASQPCAWTTTPPITSFNCPASTLAPPSPAYATGTCAFHLTETQDCADDSKNLYAIVKLVDANKADIGDTPVTDSNPLGAPINAGDPYSFDSKLPNPIVITGEHKGDYIQFTYGSLSWKSTDKGGQASCNVGGQDPRDGPICGGRTGNTNAVKNMDCFFPC